MSVGKALIRCLGHPSAPKHKAVDLLRHGVKPVDRVLPLFAADDKVRIKDTLRVFNPLHPGNRVNLVPAPAVGGEQPQIKHILRIRILLSRRDHIGFCGTKSHKNSGAQSNNYRNRDKTPHGTEDGLAQVFGHHTAFHYHSISAMS